VKFQTGKVPNWAIRDPRVLSAIDFAVLAPVGYASYLVIHIDKKLIDNLLH